MLICTNKLQFSPKLIIIVVKVIVRNDSLSGGTKRKTEAEPSGKLIIRKCQAKLCAETQ